MIHYHGGELGGWISESVPFWRNRHLFVSFAYPRSLPAYANLCSSFAIDNGAFTIWRKTKGRLDIEAYREYVKEWGRHPSCDWHLIPDVIDGDERENIEIEQRWHEPNAVPVWHLHESLEWLKILTQRYGRIALGSSGQYATIETTEWRERMNEAFKIICDDQGRPRCKVHGLRMLSTRVVPLYPFSSCDSTNAARNSGDKGRFRYTHPMRGVRAAQIADLVELVHSPPTFSEITTEAREVKQRNYEILRSRNRGNRKFK